VIKVRLSLPEVMFAAQAGTMRRVQGLKEDRLQRYGGGPSPDMVWQIDIVSCISEMALAKYLDRYWSGDIGNVMAPADVGKFYQVRATEWANGKLRLHPDDKDHQPYVLARVLHQTVTFVGWLYAREGKKPQYWKAIQPSRPERVAYWVPGDELHDMAELPPEPAPP
jgi:hypothetical protein